MRQWHFQDTRCIHLLTLSFCLVIYCSSTFLDWLCDTERLHFRYPLFRGAADASALPALPAGVGALAFLPSVPNLQRAFSPRDTKQILKISTEVQVVLDSILYFYLPHLIKVQELGA